MIVTAGEGVEGVEEAELVGLIREGFLKAVWVNVRPKRVQSRAGLPEEGAGLQKWTVGVGQCGNRTPGPE